MELLFCNCAVAAEVSGNTLQLDKAKKRGVKILGPKGPEAQLLVIGLKAPLRIILKDITQVDGSRVKEGRLGITAKGRIQVVLREAQPCDLQHVVNTLKQCSQPGLPPALPLPTPARNVQKAAEGQFDKRCMPATDSGSQSNKDAMFSQSSFGRLADETMRLILLFGGRCEDPENWLDRALGSTCKLLNEKHISRSRSVSIQSKGNSAQPELVVNCVARRTNLQHLSLSGFQFFDIATFKKLSQTLSGLGGGLSVLRLSNCKFLVAKDAAVRQLLLSCPALQTLDLLQVPRLSNKCLEAPLRNLRHLALGCHGVTQRPETERSQSARIVIDTGATASKLKDMKGKAIASSLFTQELFTEGRSGLSQAGLETLILANCQDFTVIPQLRGFGRTLRHLDFQGCDLQAPEDANWRPFASLVNLSVLVLARCPLSALALRSCVASLPTPGQQLDGPMVPGLKVLDVADTLADMAFVEALLGLQRGLTHLGLSGCRLRSAALSAVLCGLHVLEFLNFTVDFDACIAMREVRSALQAEGRSLNLKVLGTPWTPRSGLDLEALRRELGRTKLLGREISFFGMATMPPQSIS